MSNFAFLCGCFRTKNGQVAFIIFDYIGICYGEAQNREIRSVHAGKTSAEIDKITYEIDRHEKVMCEAVFCVEWTKRTVITTRNMIK